MAPSLDEVPGSPAAVVAICEPGCDLGDRHPELRVARQATLVLRCPRRSAHPVRCHAGNRAGPFGASLVRRPPAPR